MPKGFRKKINQSEAEFVLGKDKPFLKIAETSVFCHNCYPQIATIVDYEFFVNDLGDLSLVGKCQTCGGPVGRYIESGENKSAFNRAMKVVEMLKSKSKTKS